ncbi:ABC transporter permease/M1 family aminopeptidase [Glaciecola siphonariae]|uniref:ABC transporter permease/M1 family aminopeptidase n=1 Tax=Glaciecola siphonariae TaxID=521012 RepID=A0ABV9LSZ3_9ALTE
MIANMMRFEWRYFTRQPSFIVTSLVFFLLPFLAVTIDNVQIGASSNVNINSPVAIAQTLLVFGIFGMFLVVNFVANTAIRNDVSAMNEIIITKPLSAFKYQLGRFLGAYAVCLTVFSMIPLALIVGSMMPWLDQERVGAFSLMAYVAPFVVFSITTLFFLSTVFYAAALRFRSMMAVYLVALGIFMLYVISGQVFSDPGQREWVSLLDPFALNTFDDIIRYWTPSERNTQIVGLTDAVLLNRALWLSLGVVILLTMGRLFAGLALPNKNLKLKKSGPKIAPPLNNAIDATYSNNKAGAQFFARLRFELKQVFFSPAFGFLMLFCGFSLISILIDPQGIYGAPNWPLTQYMVELIQGAFGLAIIIIITYYSAEVVWRERTVGMGDIVDSMPVSNLTFWLSKIIAVSLVIVAVHFVGMAATVLNQAAKGYAYFDFSQYFISLLYFQALPWILLVVLAFLFQALSPNKYVGMLAFVGFFFISLTFRELGLEHNMFRYRFSPSMQYSDMNGYGWALTTQHYYMFYWGALALVFSALSFGLWQRGPQSSIKERFAMLGYQLGGTGRAMVVVATLLFVGSGTIIHYNTTVTNEFMNSEARMDLQAEYENTFAQFEDAPVPMVSAVDINVAIFPESRRLETIAKLKMVNRSEKPIERFLINLPQYSSDIRINIEGGKLSALDERFDTAWLEFETPLPVGAEIEGEISLVRQHFGFKDRGEDTTLVKNGTFINNFELLPTFGVNQSYFISDRHERRKRDLPPPRRAHPLEDESRYNESFFGAHIGLIDFSATLSTSANQIAIAPGYLAKYWTEGERNYFRYEMDSPMINFYNVMSADLELKTQVHNGVEISVYYHRTHAWNVDRMIESVRDSIDLFSEAFGPYQHKQLRVIEFPGYRTFAQSFANTVPYSERIGFITDLRDPDNIDPVYYITAHEVAHQWFGHQLNAANVQGSAILSESLSQYAALLVMQQKYGESKIREFLSFELDTYLQGRTQEALDEMPLMRAENQQYIHYNKGSVVMMAIADRIGIASMNEALRGLIERFKFSRGRQPTTLDLLAAIKAQSPSEHHKFIEQQFEQISIYDLRLKDVQIAKSEDNRYQVTFDISAAQFSADGKGEENEERFEDYVDIVLFANDPDDFSGENEILYRKKHLLKQGDNQVRVELESLPAYAGVDPFVRYIDRETRDNIMPVPAL